MSRPMGHGLHLVRMAGLFLAGIVLFVIARKAFVPDGFGELGHFRTGALADNMARNPVFAGRTACGECHSDEPDRLKAGPHAKVGCEACHGALGRHASGESEDKPALPDAAKLCLVCHRQSVSKPAGFPQVDPKDHMDGSGNCVGCHDPHAPDKEPPAPPADGKEAKKP